MSHKTKTLLSLGLMLLAGCAGDAAPDFAGHWQPVNRYQAASTSSSRMPVYAASTRDGSLRQLLRRWSGSIGGVAARSGPGLLAAVLPVCWTIRCGRVCLEPSGVASEGGDPD